MAGFPSRPALRLFHIEGHASLARMLREAVCEEPGVIVVGEAESVGAALEALPGAQPDVILLDLHLPDMSGLDAIPLLSGAVPGASLILLLDRDDPRYRQAAAERGASACVCKDHIAAGLPAALRGCLNDAGQLGG